MQPDLDIKTSSVDSNLNGNIINNKGVIHFMDYSIQ